MSAICGSRLVAFADYVTEVPVRLQSGQLWRTVDGFAFRLLAEKNMIWGRKERGKLTHCFLQNVSPDDALLLIDRVRRASMVRGRPETSQASKTFRLEQVQDYAPIYQHHRNSSFRPEYRGRPDLVGPAYDFREADRPAATLA